MDAILHLTLRKSIMYKANSFRDKNNLQMIPNDKPGYYRWWAKKPEFDLILSALDIDYDDIVEEVLETDGMYSIYVGIAAKESIRNRINWHINDIHSASRVKTGTLSTLRQSISSIVSHNQYDKESTDKFIDKLSVEVFPIDYQIKSEEAIQELDKIEKTLLSENLYVLNIRDNDYSEMARQIRRRLSKIRSESKKA